MLLAEAGCVFMAFILCISGVQGQAKSICALKGSSVDLPCSAQHPTSSKKWFIVDWDSPKPVLNELFKDGNRVMYSKSEESHPTLTINDLRKSDAKVYCCSESAENPQDCWQSVIFLRVADLQMKVIPATEGQTVSLICSSSCPPIENPTAYIWYKNGEFLYQDWSPWYQQLVSSEEAVRYSCAIKGYEHLRAPEVSVDSVTSTCFTVTYAKGRMCSEKQTSVNESCSITYPRGLEVKLHPAVVTEGQRVTLTCSTSCPLTDDTNYIWYLNSRPLTVPERQNKHLVLDPVSIQHAGNYSCAVKTHQNINSGEKTLTVQSITRTSTAAVGVVTATTPATVEVVMATTPATAGVVAALLVIIPLTVFFWIRRKRSSSRSPRLETSDNMEQLNPGPVYEDTSAQATEQDDLHYSRINFSKNQTDPLYTTVQPHQPQEQEHVPYAVVHFRSNTTPE